MDIRHIHIHIIFGPVCCHYYLIVWYIKLNMSFLNQSKNKTIRLIRFRRMSISFWHGGLTGNSWLCVLLCRKQSAIDQYNQFLCEIGKFIDHAGLTSTDHKTGTLQIFFHLYMTFMFFPSVLPDLDEQGKNVALC